jgi:hypothetical protein
VSASAAAATASISASRRGLGLRCRRFPGCRLVLPRPPSRNHCGHAGHAVGLYPPQHKPSRAGAETKQSRLLMGCRQKGGAKCSPSRSPPESISTARLHSKTGTHEYGVRNSTNNCSHPRPMSCRGVVHRNKRGRRPEGKLGAAATAGRVAKPGAATLARQGSRAALLQARGAHPSIVFQRHRFGIPLLLVARGRPRKRGWASRVLSLLLCFGFTPGGSSRWPDCGPHAAQQQSWQQTRPGGQPLLSEQPLMPLPDQLDR